MELLIVIGVLGILAAGLLAAIDPFEQLKKARDTNNRSATIEMLSSLTRYYASHGAFPWNMPAYAATGVCSRATGKPLAPLGKLGTSVMDLQDPALQACMSATLLVDGELKSTYFGGIGATHIYVASDPTDLTNVQVCFGPEGKSARSDPSTSYLVAGAYGTPPITITDQTGVTPALCPNAALSTCLQCFK